MGGLGVKVHHFPLTLLVVLTTLTLPCERDHIDRQTGCEVIAIFVAYIQDGRQPLSWIFAARRYA